MPNERLGERWSFEDIIEYTAWTWTKKLTAPADLRLLQISVMNGTDLNGSWRVILDHATDVAIQLIDIAASQAMVFEDVGEYIEWTWIKTDC